jgi:hypothetical protein
MNKIIVIVLFIWLYLLSPCFSPGVPGTDNKNNKKENHKKSKTLQNNPQKNAHATGKGKDFSNNSELEPLTAKDVYRMIIDNGFYCDITPGSPFHQEALKSIQNSPKMAFPLKRKITTVKEQNGFILTKSIHTRAAQNNENKKIQLRWTPKITYCTYEQAIEIIRILNKTYTDKKQTWRIPTVMELFSIMQDKSKNHLPPAFKLTDNQTLVFWTSTPVKKQGTVLEYDKKNPAYFVVRSLYDKNKDTYSLGFGFQNIGPTYKTNAFLIPVLSSKVYTYQPIPPARPPQSIKPTTSPPQQPKKSPQTANKPPAKTPQTTPLPKSHGPDKIPGFDDYKGPTKKQTKKTVSAGKKTGQPYPGNIVPGFDHPTGSTNTKPAVSYTFKIALYPIFREGIVDDDKEKFLENLKKQIKREVFVLAAKVKRELTYGLSLEEKKLNIFDGKSRKEIGQLNKIIVDPYLSQAAKLRKIKDEIMSAPHIDMVIVIRYFDTDDDDIYFLVPTIISGISHEIYSFPFVLRKSQAGILSKYVKEITGKIIYNFFSIRSR